MARPAKYSAEARLTGGAVWAVTGSWAEAEAASGIPKHRLQLYRHRDDEHWTYGVERARAQTTDKLIGQYYRLQQDTIEQIAANVRNETDVRKLGVLLAIIQDKRLTLENKPSKFTVTANVEALRKELVVEHNRSANAIDGTGARPRLFDAVDRSEADATVRPRRRS